MLIPVLSRRAQVGRWSLIGLSVTALLGAFVYAGGWFDPDRLSPRQLINGLEANAGVYPGFRRAHAKGLCVSGYFVSNGQASGLSQAALFAPGRVPVSGRLAIGGGNPHAADISVPVRSLALLLQQVDGQQWRMAMNSAPVLAVATPQAFYAQVQAMRPDPVTGKPDPARLQAFYAAHPESGAFRQWLQQQRPSSSFANTRFNSINAFYLVNAAGARQAVRWSLQPQSDFAVLDFGVAPAADVLQDDLLARMAERPLRWDLQLSLAAAEDPIDHASRAWPEQRRQVHVGTLVLEQAVSQQDGSCRDINFDPLILPVGIEPSADPILLARSAAYAESFKRRSREGAPAASVGVQP